MKKLNYRVIFTITALAIILGFAYNYSDIESKGLSFLTSKGPAISDSLLDAGLQPTGDQNKELEGGTITYEQLKSRLDNPSFLVIDARSPEEYSKGKIGDAINIFPYDDEAVYMEKIYTLPRDKKYLIYCTGGDCDLSHHLAEDMTTAGFENIFIYVGGWEEWIKK